MVPVSWPLLRSHCASIGRSQLTKSTCKFSQVRFFSCSPQTRHTATLSFARLAHSFVEPSQSADTPPKTTDFPINVIEKQASIRSFAFLVDNGKIDEASRALSDLFDASTANEDLDAFQQVKDILSAAEKDVEINGLITQLGSIAASKGQIQFVKDQVIPLLSHTGGQGMVSELESKLSNVKVDSKMETDMFEDALDDYATTNIALSPSTLEIIEQQLPALLPSPVAEDASLFEENMDEETFSSTNQSTHSEFNSGGFLNTLISNGQYEEAFQFVKEMTAIGSRVPVSSQYIDIALFILQSTESPSMDQIDRALAWLSLMPKYYDLHANTNVPPRLQNLTRHLLSKSAPDIGLLIRTSVIFASKGFVHPTKHLIPVIVRNIDAERCEKFITKFEDAYLHFWKDTTSSRRTEHRQRVENFFRNRVVSTLIGNRRLGEAIDILHERGDFTLWRSTHAYLSRLPTKSLRLSQILKNIKVVEDAEIENIRVTVMHMDFRQDFRVALRYVKNVLASKTQVPHPFTIVNFINQSLSIGRTTGLRILFDRAHRTNGLLAVNFTFAEMLFYRRLGLPELVVETFVEHFYLHGLPEERILKAYNSIKRKRITQESQRLPILKTRFYKYDESKFPGRKLWPTTIQYNVLWNAIICMSPRSAVHDVYAAFIGWAREQYDSKGKPRLATDVSSPRLTSSSFHAFLRPLMQTSKSRAQVGEQIFRDMLDLGIQPHIYVYTELAGFYAGHSNAQAAFAMMDQLEQRKKTEHKRRDGTTFVVTAPAPDLVFYVSVLRGFLVNRNIAAAEFVAQRIKQVTDYEPEENQHLDTALKDLESLKRLGDKWIYVCFIRVYLYASSDISLLPQVPPSKREHNSNPVVE